MLAPSSGQSEPARCEERPLSLLHHLASVNSLSSLRRANEPSGPYTLLTLPAEWVARILSYLSPDEKLTEVSHVSSAIHRSVVSLSSSFRDDFISFASLPLPPLLALSPWFKGVSGVSVRGHGPDPFQLDKHGDGESSEQQSVAESESDSGTATDALPVSSMPSPRRLSLLAASSSTSSSIATPSSPFSSIRSLSISLSLDSSSPAVRSPPPTLLSSLSSWSNLRHLHIVADDTDDWLTAANLNCGLLTAQDFHPFLLLVHLRSLTLDATVKAEQVMVLAGMDTLQCLLLTEREQRAGVDEERWQREEERMMAALSWVSRLVRKGKGLTQLRMPRFHFSALADEFCESLSEARVDASPSPMSSLCVQGTLSTRGISALASLPELTSLTLGWGCELDADDRTIMALPQCRDLQHLHVRLIDPHEQDEHDEETYVPYLPALPHVLSVSSLTSLSLHLPVGGWAVQHSRALSTLTHLCRLTIAGEASGISVRHPLTYDKLLPLISVDDNGKRPLPHLRSLTLDWLPLLDDAMLVIAQLSELTSLSLLNCPYLSSFLFCVLPALPSLVKLRVYRCDVNLTEKGWRDASDVLHYFRHILPSDSLPLLGGEQACFPHLQVLECHLVHRLSCDVDAVGFSRLLSLLPPRHLHTFDFDSDYCNSSMVVQLSAFPHLRSLGSLSVDISPLDTELILAAKRSMSIVLACYYDRQYTRIERGERSRWRSRRRSSSARFGSPDSDKPVQQWWLRGGEADVEDDEEQRVLPEEGDDELDMDEPSSGRWRDREERWCSQPRGVQFRHQQARDAFFGRLATIESEERQRAAAGEVLQRGAVSATQIVNRNASPAGAAETDSDEEDSGTGKAQVEAYNSLHDGEAEDDSDETWEQEEEEGPGRDEDDEADDEDCEWEWSQPASSSSSSSSLSVSLVGRSSKLHSRRYKRDEKMAIRLKASLPHTVDKSVRRSSASDGVRLAGVVGQRKWEYAAALR